MEKRMTVKMTTVLTVQMRRTIVSNFKTPILPLIAGMVTSLAMKESTSSTRIALKTEIGTTLESLMEKEIKAVLKSEERGGKDWREVGIVVFIFEYFIIERNSSPFIGSGWRWGHRFMRGAFEGSDVSLGVETSRLCCLAFRPELCASTAEPR